MNTGHPFLDLSVKTGLAFVDATFRGDRPKYRVKHYAEARHDGFPPGAEKAPYCLVCQLVAARAGRLLVKG